MESSVNITPLERFRLGREEIRATSLASNIESVQI